MPNQLQVWDISLICGIERIFKSNAHCNQFLKLHYKKCKICESRPIHEYTNTIYLDKNDTHENKKNKQQNKKESTVIKILCEGLH